MTSFHELKRSLSEALVQLLWDQWVSIGVAGATRSRPVPFVVDPEALLLATTWFGLGDARLFGETLDWLAGNGKLLGAQRLKSLHRGGELGDSRVLGAMVRHLGEHAPGHQARALRLAASASPEIPDLSKWFGDSAFEPRGHAFRPDPGAPEAFLFKMRSFFGLNARAEIFSWLVLERDSGHPARIARETGWLGKTVQVVLNEMAESGLVFVSEGEREKQFRIDPETWRFLLPKGDRPAWFCQHPFYAACHRLAQLLDELSASDEASDAARAVKIRKILPAVSRDFGRAKQPVRFEIADRLRGAELVDAFQAEAARLVEEIGDRFALLPRGHA